MTINRQHDPGAGSASRYASDAATALDPPPGRFGVAPRAAEGRSPAAGGDLLIIDRSLAEAIEGQAWEAFVDANRLHKDLRDTLSPADAHRLDALVDRIGSLAAMIDGVARLARARAGVLQRSDVDMPELVRQVWDEIERLHGSYAGGFVIASMPSGYADACALWEVWSQLLANARSFARAPHRIEIIAGSVADGTDGTVYYVADNGVGFTPDEIKRMYQPFVRLHPGDRHSGVGVGLSIVRTIAERHGGRAWCESGPGEGARFCFTLGPATRS